MADDSSGGGDEKTEEPTPYRIQQAFKEGQTYYSREVTNFLMILALTYVIVVLGPSLVKESLFLKYFIENSYDLDVSEQSLGLLFKSIFRKTFFIIAIPVFITLIIALSSSFIQTGRFYISLKGVIPQLSKLSILKGLNKIFSFQSFIEFFKNIIKIFILMTIAYFIILDDLSKIKLMHSFNIVSINEIIMSNIHKILMLMCIVMGIIAIFDYFSQRFAFYNRLKMSKYELKQEFKETEGNPEIKAKLKQLRVAKARKRMMAAIPHADVVITNPTHYAVALKYKKSKMNAPILVAKGLDSLALKMKEIARKNNVSIIENPPLARALYASTEIDEEIPIEHYKAVAEIISYIYKIKRNKSKI